jgi:hypothetical protein
MGKSQKSRDSECYTHSSDPFRFYGHNEDYSLWEHGITQFVSHYTASH